MWRHSGNATITKHNLPDAPKDGGGIPVNTQCHNNVVTTSLQRRDVAATL